MLFRSCRPVDEALPRHSARSRVHGTSPSRTCTDRGGVVLSVLGSINREDVRLHQPCCHNASAYGLRGYVGNTLPLSLLCITMILRVRRNFLKLLRSPTVVSEPGLCVDVMCTSRIQRSCGRGYIHIACCH